MYLARRINFFASAASPIPYNQQRREKEEKRGREEREKRREKEEEEKRKAKITAYYINHCKCNSLNGHTLVQ